MKITLLTFFFLLSYFNLAFAQALAPNLGTASTFTLFTAVGAFTNTGYTRITGDIGSNTTQPTGDPITMLNGTPHFMDSTSGKAARDLQVAYDSLGLNTCTNTLAAEMGGQTLTKGVYCTVGAATLNGTLLLDGQGDTTALFIIKVDGAFATAPSSQVVLLNGASLENVFFYVTGQVDIGPTSTFQGTILSGGAIYLLQSATLKGRALTTAGAINTYGNTVMTFEGEETTLPVVLTNFSAVAKSKGVTLVWTTASEQDNERFEVERSHNGKTFSKIGEVKGSGTSAVLMTYTFLDLAAPTGTSYYRLRQVDTDGQHQYSHVISCHQTVASFQHIGKVYPNPSTGMFMLPASGGAVQHYRVLNVLGYALAQGTLKNGSLDLSHLSAGTYLLELTGASGRSIQRIVRQ
ncbi:ice-binding family protein [Rufibacter glacialis]|uniref:DUF3494 domain-containing protein n=1 Tax=Rufibacter glacialis TaxID=1259555 RepID=A0A5M8Q6L3_9BACT|nr:ice-binding family protein [Rufibacter glacialis]KAA6430748.1 DUF3494 domain-containing protein [Rufibacter glacialis]GGK86433.1 hypothetical protein GCM10011405_37700 [Rufibacter glacialis]